MTDKTMTLEQAAEYGWKHASWDLENVLMGVRERHLSQPAERGEAAAYGWSVERKGDPTFPRLFSSESAADRLIASVTVNPPATKRPLYTAPPPAAGVPDGMLDRIDAAIQRITDGHAPRRIPADPTDVDLVLAEVRSWLTGQGWPPFWIPTAPEAKLHG